MAGAEDGELGRLLYQGGDRLVASWDHDVWVVFDPGGIRATGLTATLRKRVFPFKRVD